MERIGERGVGKGVGAMDGEWAGGMDRECNREMYVSIYICYAF